MPEVMAQQTQAARARHWAPFMTGYPTPAPCRRVPGRMSSAAWMRARLQLSGGLPAWRPRSRSSRARRPGPGLGRHWRRCPASAVHGASGAGDRVGGRPRRLDTNIQAGPGPRDRSLCPRRERKITAARPRPGGGRRGVDPRARTSGQRSAASDPQGGDAPATMGAYWEVGLGVTEASRGAGSDPRFEATTRLRGRILDRLAAPGRCPGHLRWDDRRAPRRRRRPCARGPGGRASLERDNGEPRGRGWPRLRWASPMRDGQDACRHRAASSRSAPVGSSYPERRHPARTGPVGTRSMPAAARRPAVGVRSRSSA